MSDKQIVEDLLQRIPEGASLHDIAREIEFIAAVRKGFSELDRGEGTAWNVEAVKAKGRALLPTNE